MNLSQPKAYHHTKIHLSHLSKIHPNVLRQPYVTGQAIIFLPCGFFLLSSLFLA